ncbi:unnamed protein product [Calypogeia fissa]
MEIVPICEEKSLAPDAPSKRVILGSVGCDGGCGSSISGIEWRVSKLATSHSYTPLMFYFDVLLLMSNLASSHSHQIQWSILNLNVIRRLLLENPGRMVVAIGRCGTTRRCRFGQCFIAIINPVVHPLLL